ncbi:MAG: hypothetical protein IJ620_04435 [Bacteroidales bacterium]|nr:hypothetical protein [Bacteroidales bacterium]
MAQKKYDKNWKSIEQHIEKQSYKSGYKEAEEVFQKAGKEHQSTPQLIAAWYMARMSMAYQEEAEKKAIERYEGLLDNLEEADRMVCHSLLATLYDSYRSNFDLDEKERAAKLAEHRRLALNDEELLKRTPIEPYKTICLSSGDELVNLTPTLYDLLVREEMKRCEAKEQCEWLEKLKTFHANDSDKGLSIYLEMELLEMRDHIPNSTKATIEDYKAILAKYQTLKHRVKACIYVKIARMLDSHDEKKHAIAYCDSVITLYAGSAEAKECRILKERILMPHIDIQSMGVELSQRSTMTVATVRNAERVYYRVIACTKKEQEGLRYAERNTMQRKKAVASWDQPIEGSDDHLDHKVYCYVPSLPSGHYILLASATDDFKTHGYEAVAFDCCDGQLIAGGANGSLLQGYAVDQKTGKPIAKHTIRLERTEGETTALLAQTQTDQNGWYSFDRVPEKKSYYSNHYVVIDYDGLTLRQPVRLRYGQETTNDRQCHLSLMTDRPVYKPGEEVHFAVVAYQSDHWMEAETHADVKVFITLRDINYTDVDTLTLMTNAKGMANGIVTIPTDGLPGSYHLNAKAVLILRDSRPGNNNEQPENLIQKPVETSQIIKVEAYKQPTFAVSIESRDKEHQFGKTTHITGKAISYNQIPINDAKVIYSVERSQRRYWWRWWQEPDATVVASGETTTDGEGVFEIDFVPEVDSSVELTPESVFTYTIKATVADLNGETHEQQMSIHVGYRSGMLAIMNDEETSELNELVYRYTNMDGEAIKGDVAVKIEQLKMPEEALLIHRHHDGSVAHTMSKEEFAERYPGIEYDERRRDKRQWATANTVYQASVKAPKEQTENRVALPALGEGVYRISLSATDPKGEKIGTTSIVSLTPPKSRQCQSMDLLWSDIDRKSIEVGEKVTLRIGSRQRDVTVFVAISDGNGDVERQVMTISEGIASMTIKASKAMLGGMHVALAAVKNGVITKKEYRIDVPYTHKKLTTRLATFRDKLQPGSKETWTLQIENMQQEGVAATTVMSMYDAALDNYGSLQWRLWPWRGDVSKSHLNIYQSDIYSRYSNQPEGQYFHSKFTPLSWQLNTETMSYSLRRHRMYKTQAMSNDVMYCMSAMPEAVKTADIESFEESADDIAAPDAGMAGTEKETANPSHVEVQPRENLNTLAFFYPDIASNSQGQATIQFQVPELLTQWNVKALSYTTDLQVGEMQQQVVTQKELMVMPMIPRFFRQGDSAVVAVKVSNATNEVQEATVSLELADAESGSAWGHYDEQKIKVPAHGSAVAKYAVAVPTTSYAVVYKITAYNEHHSDGEQNVVAVVSNRQMVTESQAMYVNGRGGKRYALPMPAESKSREMRLMAVEFTSNPIWLAIQALPYVSEHENPSNIYLANRLFSNSMARKIVNEHPTIKNVFDQWQHDITHTPHSSLNMNEDIKQTLAEESPWLQEAENEEQRVKEIANYFDKARIEQELDQTIEKLVLSQRDDGGWSWIPGGERSSVYTTRHILRMLATTEERHQAPLQAAIRRALQYVDQEVSKDYAEYKKHKVKDGMDVDYLYLRSCYGKVPVSTVAREAYTYYMGNAKRLCLKQSGLYYRAKLAVVMERAGEHKLAVQLVEQLKEVSLENDEMGMYWRDNVSGYFNHERPIEVQSYLIEAFREVMPDDRESVAKMRQWLLKQKQTTSWNSDIASVSAIAAMLSGGAPLAEGTPAQIVVGTTVVNSAAQAGTGYVSQRWRADDIKPDMDHVIIRQTNESIGWGAVYWQYVEDIDKIASSSMGVKLEKIYLLMRNNQTTPLRNGDHVSIGDRIRIQILVSSDRNLEYLELKDGRPAGFEPVSSASGWRWSDGLSYYAAVTQTALHCYIDRLDKGSYVVSYDLFATQEGTFSTGLSEIQSLYAPEFRAIAHGANISVKERR